MTGRRPLAATTGGLNVCDATQLVTNVSAPHVAISSSAYARARRGDTRTSEIRLLSKQWEKDDILLYRFRSIFVCAFLVTAG